MIEHQNKALEPRYLKRKLVQVTVTSDFLKHNRSKHVTAKVLNPKVLGFLPTSLYLMLTS